MDVEHIERLVRLEQDFAAHKAQDDVRCRIFLVLIGACASGVVGLIVARLS